MDDGLTPILVKRDGPRGWKRINKKDFDPSKHERYVGAPPPFTPPPVTLAPPPGPVDPLASLAADWRDSVGNTELRNIAAAIGDGRAVDNRDQAIAVIDAALLAKASQ